MNDITLKKWTTHFSKREIKTTHANCQEKIDNVNTIVNDVGECRAVYAQCITEENG